MSLFRLDASIRVDGSASREIADLVETEWRAQNPDGAVTRRHVGTEPVPAGAWAAAVGGSRLPAQERTPEQAEAVALAATLADELIDAEALLFAVPLYNFGVSQHFKAWVDLVITDIEMARMDGVALRGEMKKDGQLAQIPVIVVTSREKREDQERGLALGADAYLPKPVDWDRLAAVVGEHRPGAGAVPWQVRRVGSATPSVAEAARSVA